MSRRKSNGCLPRTRDRVTVALMAASPRPRPAGVHARPTGDRLTERQRQVLEFIDAEVQRRGYPPSVREIGEAGGLSSPPTGHPPLAAPPDKGYLRRGAAKPRGMENALQATHGAA